MIKCKDTITGHRVQAEGSTSTLLADLSRIITSLITDGEIAEELIDIAVGLGKAEAKGKAKDYMAETMLEIIKKATDKKQTVEVGIDFNELMKQIKKEKEENED